MHGRFSFAFIRASKVDETKLKKLHDAYAWSRKQQQPFRDSRVESIRVRCGNHYGPAQEDAAKILVNLDEIAVLVYTQALVSNNPRATVDTFHTELKSRVFALSEAINFTLKRIRFQDILRRAALNAMYGLTIVKTGLALEGSVGAENWRSNVGEVFCDVITLDDWVHDMSAKNWRGVQFMGDRFRMPISDVKESGLFDPDVVKKLKTTGGWEANSRLSFDERDNSAKTISRSDRNSEELEETIELWNIYLPRENKIVTMAMDADEKTQPLREIEWEGPEHDYEGTFGPYHLLYFGEVPDNTMPLPPLDAWRDLHDVMNSLWRKCTRQAERAKSVPIYSGKDVGAAEALNKAGDGQWTKVEGGKNVIESANIPGVDGPTLAFAMQLKDIISYMAGNLDLLTGASPASETVGQDKMLLEAASKRLQAMQHQMLSFSNRLVRDIGWYLWTDPMIDLPLARRVEGLTIPLRFSPEERKGEFFDYNITVIPYSLQEDSPAQRVEKMMKIWNGVVLPSAQMMMQQGVMPDVGAFLQALGEEMNMKNIGEFIKFKEVSQREALGPIGSDRNRPKQAANTTRTQVRINRPGATSGGKNAAMMQMMLGGGVQPAEAAAIGRPNG